MRTGEQMRRGHNKSLRRGAVREIDEYRKRWRQSMRREWGGMIRGVSRVSEELEIWQR